MKEYNAKVTIGLDLGNKKHTIFAIDEEELKQIDQKQIENNLERIEIYFSKFPDPTKVKVVMEAGSQSPWISDYLSKKGFKIFIANPRKLRMIWKSDNKNDYKDAEMLAKIGRLDPSLLYPIKHRNIELHTDLNIIKCRNALVKSRTTIISAVRGLLKSKGITISDSSTESFATKAQEEIKVYKELYLVIKNMLEIVKEITVKVKSYDKMIQKIIEKKYPEAKQLQQITGVGPITSLTFILTLADPTRFKKSRDAGAYIGLVPKRDQSGEVDKQLSITKAGNNYLRSVLVSAAHYIVGPFGIDSDLKRYASRISERGGKTAKKKAVVAVARKLAVLMHCLWKSGEMYDPLRNSKKKEKKAA